MMIRTVVIALLAACVALACASTTQSAPKPTVRSESVRQQPASAVQPAPALPKTASPMPVIGWTGLAALGLGTAVRAVRRRR